MNSNPKGISQQANGNWSYRFVIFDQYNVRHDVRKNTDENGHPLTSKQAAIKAKTIELNKWKNKIAEKVPVSIDNGSITVSELFSEYQQKVPPLKFLKNNHTNISPRPNHNKCLKC